MTITAEAPPVSTPPPARAWYLASHDRPCPTCSRLIRKGDAVALVAGPAADGSEPDWRHVCANCTSSPKPARRQR